MKSLCIAGFIACLVLCQVSVASAENYIGIILDGYQKDCSVRSRGEDYDCKENRLLYAGDKVIKSPDIKALKIKWAPYAQGKELDATSLTVVFEPPKDKKGIVQGIKEVLGLVKTGHAVSVGATRGGSARPKVPQPGNNATLLPGTRAVFVWESEGGKHIVFKDSTGAEVFKRDLKGQSFIELSPEEIGMKPSGGYSWSISGSRIEKQFTVRLIAADIASQVNADLREIDSESISDTEKRLKKAAYLQFMSDSYVQDIDLYWLSYQLLEGTGSDKGLKQDEELLREELKRNYLRHVREMM